MKILFTKKEYRQLLDLVYLGDWVASADREDDSSPYEALREKIYSYAKEFGYGDLIVYDKQFGKHIETSSFEEQGVNALLDHYHHHIKTLEAIVGRS